MSCVRTAEQARHVILAYVQRHKSAKVAPIAAFLSMDADKVRRYLDALIAEGKVHRTTGPQQSSGGRSFIYHFGPAPKPAAKSWQPLGITDPWMLPAGFFQGGQAV